jgi:hypothetical protein
VGGGFFFFFWVATKHLVNPFLFTFFPSSSPLYKTQKHTHIYKQKPHTNCQYLVVAKSNSKQKPHTNCQYLVVAKSNSKQKNKKERKKDKKDNQQNSKESFQKQTKEIE